MGLELTRLIGIHFPVSDESRDYATISLDMVHFHPSLLPRPSFPFREGLATRDYIASDSLSYEEVLVYYLGSYLHNNYVIAKQLPVWNNTPIHRTGLYKLYLL